jgi:hypothetical protein
MSGAFYFPKSLPASQPLHYDNDGDLTFLAGAKAWIRHRKAAADAGRARAAQRSGLPRRHTHGPFHDADGSGIVAAGYGMGVAAGDIDNDGWTDLYVTNLA